MAEQRSTDGKGLQNAALLRDIGRCSRPSPGDDPDLVTLMRLASDPLLLSSFLRTGRPQRAMPASGQACIPVAVLNPLVPFVPNEDISTDDTLRRYIGTDGSTSRSLHPVRFFPSEMDCVCALDTGYAAKAPEFAPRGSPLRVTFGVLLAALITAALTCVLLLVALT